MTNQTFVVPDASVARRTLIACTMALAATLPATALRAQTSDLSQHHAASQ